MYGVLYSGLPLDTKWPSTFSLPLSLPPSFRHSANYLPDFALHGTSCRPEQFEGKMLRDLASMVKVRTCQGSAYVCVCVSFYKCVLRTCQYCFFNIVLTFDLTRKVQTRSSSLLPSLPHFLPPSLQHPIIDEPVEHGVAIIADTDTWTCKLSTASKSIQTK